MFLLLHRIAMRDTYTIGRLYEVSDDGARHYLCDTLEPSMNPKDRSEPRAIPSGCYVVVVTLSPRFGTWLPLLLGVPRRSGIRIHAGNSALDTRGCILVGQNLTVGHVLNSRSTLNKLMQLLNERKQGEGIKLTVES